MEPDAAPADTPLAAASPIEVRHITLTLIGPLTPRAGTVARIAVELITTKSAEAPPNFTAETAMNVLPVMSTVVPATPLAGVKLSTRGVTLKLAALVKAWCAWKDA